MLQNGCFTTWSYFGGRKNIGLNTIDFSGPVHFLCAEILKWEVNFCNERVSEKGGTPESWKVFRVVMPLPICMGFMF